MAPSEVLGIGCDWCAYCLDEALVFRRHAAIRADARERELRAERDRAAAAHSEAARTGIPVEVM